MKTFHAVLKVLRKLWGSGSGLTPQLERYCREEGVDPWALAEALRAAEAREAPPASAPAKKAPVTGSTPARSPLTSVAS